MTSSSGASAGPRTRGTSTTPGRAWRRACKPFEYEPAEIPLYTPGARWGTLGEPIRKMQKPLSPDESQKHLVLPAGFEAKLFVAEPQIAKPIWMTWDHRGRL